MSKPKIIFIHPLKTGGTSLRYMLLKEYGAAQIYPVPIGDAKEDVPYPALPKVNPLFWQLTVNEAMVKDFAVVMGHFGWHITTRLPERQIITMLRHPVRQIVSLYNFMAQSPNFTQLHPMLREMGFEAWVQSEMARPYLNNQTTYLSGHNKCNLAVALKNLEDGRLSFGILEHFAESIARWNTKFGWSMVVEHQNKSEGKPISADALQMVEGLQYDDMVLYEAALELFGKDGGGL